MKAEERLLHLCSFQLLCSLYIHWDKKKQQQKTVFRDGGREVERDKSRGTGGQKACGG